MADQSFPPEHLDANRQRTFYGIRHGLDDQPHSFRLFCENFINGNAGQSSDLNPGYGGEGHGNNQGHASRWNDFPSQNEAANDFDPYRGFYGREINPAKDVESNEETLSTNPESRDPRPDDEDLSAGALFYLDSLGCLSFGDPHPGIPDWTVGGDGFSLEGHPFVGPDADQEALQSNGCLEDILTNTGQPSDIDNTIPGHIDQGTDILTYGELSQFIAFDTDYQDMDDDNSVIPEEEEEEEEEEEGEDVVAQEEFYLQEAVTADDDRWKRRTEDRRNISQQTTNKSKGAKKQTTTKTERERERERISTKSPTRWRPILPKPNPIVLFEQRQAAASAEDAIAAELRHKRRFWKCCSESFSDYNLYKIHIEQHGIVEQASMLKEEKKKRKKRRRIATPPAGQTKNYRALAGLDRAGTLDRTVCLYCESDSHADVTRTPGFSADDMTCPQCRKPYKTLYCLRRHYCVKHSRQSGGGGGGSDSSGKPGSTPVWGPSDETDSSESDLQDEPMSSRSSTPGPAEPRNDSASVLSSLLSSAEPTWLQRRRH